MDFAIKEVMFGQKALAYMLIDRPINSQVAYPKLA